MLNVAITSFSYTEKEILKDISFSLKKGEHLAILGESGCGKSTLLHAIYGLLHLDQGTIIWEDKKLLGPKHNLIPGETFMKLVAQEFNVMPFISVAENVATHLTRRDQELDDERVAELLKIVDLEDFKDVKVKNLSGGQKQRVALAKALANEPKLLLLDEPFSNIDTFRKNGLRRQLFGYLKAKNISCITATHDSEEALSYSDFVLMLKDGAPELIGSPKEVYNKVSTPYQAGFFGEVTRLPSHLIAAETSTKSVTLLPHQLEISEEKTALVVIVKANYFKGSYFLVESVWNGQPVFFNTTNELPIGDCYYLKARLKNNR